MSRSVVCGALGLLATACLAQAAGHATTATVVVTGTVKILVSATASPALADGTMLSVSPSLRVGDATSTNQVFIYTSAKVSKGKVTYAIALPYKWAVASRSDLITVTLGLGAQSANGSESTYFSKGIAIPANGTTTTVHFAGSI